MFISSLRQNSYLSVIYFQEQIIKKGLDKIIWIFRCFILVKELVEMVQEWFFDEFRLN